MSLDVQRLVGLGRVSNFAISPDRTWLAVEVGRADDEAASYRSELWRVPLDGSDATRLGQGAFRDGSPRFRDDGALLFLSNRSKGDHGADDKPDSDAMTQVWAQLPDGRTVQLTDEPLGVSDYRTARRRLVVLTRVLPGVEHALQRQTALDRKKRGPSMLHYSAMPVRFWDHWIGDARAHFVRLDADGTRIDLTPDADRAYENGPEWDLSKDGRSVVSTHTWITALRVPAAAIDILDVETSACRQIGRQDGISHGSPVLSDDGTQLACQRGTVTKAGLGRHHVHLIDLATDQGRNLATNWDRWPSPVAWIDPTTLLCVADDRGSVPLFTLDLASQTPTSLTTPGTHGSAKVADGRIYAIRHALLEPPEVMSVPATGGPMAWHTTLAGIGRAEIAAFAEVDEMTVDAPDGGTVPLYVVRPKNTDKHHASLLWIHGGPRGQWGETWHWRWNSLVAVSQGYIVGLPNPTGSTGLGQEVIDNIWGNTWGARCYRDVMAAADALHGRPDVDETRSCAMGGSFGGYMTNWIGTQTDRFGCLITHASLFSFHQFGWTTDLPAWWQLDFGGNPWADRADYEKWSPDMHMEGWKTPTLIIHGEKDYRVPIGEGLALFECLSQLGVDAELAVFPDENHWILKPRNVVAWYDLVLGYIDRQIGPGVA